jgi:hypothetical protein
VVVFDGLKTGEVLEETNEPPQELVNHTQVASAPRAPPEIPNVVLPPLQIGEVPVANVAGEEDVLTATVVLTQLVVLIDPSARTQ